MKPFRMADPVLVVPARLASTRFPRKLLHPVRGVPLILHVARRLRGQCPQVPLWFAVAEEELATVLRAEGFDSVLTDPALPSGTDRIAAANRRIGAERVINVQADEPLVTAAQVGALARLLEGGFRMATLGTLLRSAEEFNDPNAVKVVAAGRRALWFSRAPVPYPRDVGPTRVTAEWLRTHGLLRHLGLYAYDAAFLQEFTSWPPGRLEQIEKLEQMRVVERGIEIGVDVTEDPSVGVDTPADAARYDALLG
jgi:3-deoxy-manno-octulosonate cytidylyltransferase (CMP-KDO synthetase)